MSGARMFAGYRTPDMSGPWIMNIILKIGQKPTVKYEKLKFYDVLNWSMEIVSQKKTKNGTSNAP